MLIFKGEDKRFLIKVLSKEDGAVISPENLENVKVYLTEKSINNKLIKKFSVSPEEGYEELLITDNFEISFVINRNDIVSINSIIMIQVNLYIADDNYLDGKKCIIQKGIIGKVLNSYNEG
jgi:hypothetical protein